MMSHRQIEGKLLKTGMGQAPFPWKIQSAGFGVPEYDMNREGTYRSRIPPQHLRQLWKMKRESGKPITILVAEALDRYFKSES